MLAVQVALSEIDARSGPSPSTRILLCRVQAVATVRDLQAAVQAQLGKHFSLTDIHYRGSPPAPGSKLKGYCTAGASAVPRFQASFADPIRVRVLLPDCHGSVGLSVM